jgi:hypothetical protein
MYLGYIVGDEHPLLKTISSNSIEGRNKPVLIAGMNLAIKLYPDLVDVTEKKIKEGVYYIFSESESDKNEESLNAFLYYCYKQIISKTKVIKQYLDFKNIVLNGNVFIYESDLFITITSNNLIYYLDKNIYSYFNNNKELNSKKFINQLKEEFPECSFYSWNNDFYFQAYLKTINFYVSLSDLNRLHFFDNNIELYVGVVCLEWLKEIRKINYSEKTLRLWNDAYIVDEYLSSAQVRLDKNKLSLLEDNSYYKAMESLSEGNYIQSAYNGTDKLTGRIYTAEKNFSLQTLAINGRDIIVAEPGCLLIEFDYDYFEYSLLRQLGGLDFVGDPHLNLSEFLFKDVKHREIAKSINYSTLYGKSLENTVRDVKNSFPNLKIVDDVFFNKLKTFLKPFLQIKEELESDLKKSKVIYNYFGRNIYPRKSYACLNNYTQSTAVDFFIRKILKLKEYLKKYPAINKILLQKHDSILFNINIESINNTNIVEDIISILESPEDGLIAKTSFKYGKNWKVIK